MDKLEVISIQGQTAVTADTASQKLRSPLRQFEDTSIHTLRDTVHTHKCCPALDISEMTLGGGGGGGGGHCSNKRHSWSWSGGEGETVSADLLAGIDSPVKSNTIEVLERVEPDLGHEVIMVLSQAQCSRCPFWFGQGSGQGFSHPGTSQRQKQRQLLQPLT